MDIDPPTLLPAWASSIDKGEVEVIALGQQESAAWVLIDNAHARRAAHLAGLRPKGTVGVLLAALRQDYLSLNEFDLLVQEIKARPELWISNRLCDEALAYARQQTV